MQIDGCSAYTRSFTLKSLLLLCSAGILFAPLAHAQTGMVSPSPSNCTIPGGSITCSSLISWTSSGTTAVEVWVSVNGGTETLFGSSGSGPDSENATWIQASMSYAFNLYDYSSGSRGSLLSTTTVTGSYSISLSWGNSSNSLITPNFVVGDYWTLNISGAPANAPIVWAFSLNHGTVEYYTLGYTNSSGAYTQSAQETTGSLGVYSGQWQVGSVNVNSAYPFEVIRLPDHLTVATNGATIIGGCPSPLDYGILIHINYTIVDSGGSAVTSASNVGLYPYYAFGGGGSQPVTSAATGANPADGTFVYSPLGACEDTAYSLETVSDILWIRIENSGVYDLVRSQTWNATSSAVGGGHLYNSNPPGDVNLSQ